MSTEPKPEQEKVALITGASRGIGAAAARDLAAKGVHVVLVARTVGALEAVDDAIRTEGGAATLVPLDLAKHEMIDSLALQIYERWGKLDLFIGNAAQLGALTPLAHADPKQWQQIIDVNLTANFRLIRTLDPLLRRAKAGRAIFVTADVARQPMAYWGAYAVSKAALEQLVHIYAEELHNSSVKAQLFDPGAVRTHMRAQAYPGENPESLPSPEAAAAKMLELLD